MSKDNAIRILIADDHQVVREGVAAMIDREPDMTVVAQVTNGRDAVECFRRQKPDVILMDLRMPEMEGVEAIIAIRAASPAARVIVLTTYNGDEEIYLALQAGAKGYLLKDASREELLEAIRVAYTGQTRLSADVAAKLAERVAGLGVTARELEVLRLMTAGKNNQEIASSLYIAESTVKTHINHILIKLDAADRTQAVTTALKRGIVRLA